MARVCLGAFAGAHGVRGLVKVKSFTAAPRDLASYGPLADEAGRRRFDLEVVGEVRGLLIVRVPGVEGREAAEALKGLRLYVERAALPEPEEADEFYVADLIGMAALTADGAAYGAVVAVHDFGAGDMLEIAPEGGGATVLLPFTRAAVPEVDLAAGRLVVEPPEEVGEEAEDD